MDAEGEGKKNTRLLHALTGEAKAVPVTLFATLPPTHQNIQNVKTIVKRKEREKRKETE